MNNIVCFAHLQVNLLSKSVKIKLLSPRVSSLIFLKKFLFIYIAALGLGGGIQDLFLLQCIDSLIVACGLQ